MSSRKFGKYIDNGLCMDFPKRIEQVLKALSVNQTGLAKKLGVSRGIVSEFTSGAREPSKEFLFGLSNIGISIDWFLTGEGSMFLGSQDMPSERHQPLLETSSELSDVCEDGAVEQYRLNGKNSVEMAVLKIDPDIAFVEFYPQTIGAGPGQEAESYLEATKIPVMRRFLAPWRPDQIRALEARGDSMTKIGLFDRDVVLYVPEETEGDGVFVISIDNRMQVKRIEFDILGEALKIISENDRYEPRFLEGPMEVQRVKIEGKVVGWLHRHPY